MVDSELRTLGIVCGLMIITLLPLFFILDLLQKELYWAAFLIFPYWHLEKKYFESIRGIRV